MRKWDRRWVKKQPKFCKPRWLVKALKKAGLWEIAFLKPEFSRRDWVRLLRERG